jgi:hypothetical protein
MKDTKKIGVLVMYDDLYEEMSTLTVDRNIKDYCDMYGYVLIKHKIENVDNGRAPQWQKIIESIKILESGDLDWLFFIDLDCLIMNQTIKLESLIDENYSFIIPSHGIDAVDFPMETNEFGENNVITCAYFVKNDKWGIEILKSVWECRGMPEGLNIDEFDHEGRQCRITLSMSEFKPHVKIVEERLLNRFWYMNKPFVTFQNIGINDLTWKPGDFIVHVSGYSTQERIQMLSDLNYFSGGSITKLRYENSIVYFSPLDKMEFAKIVVKDLDGNILSQTIMNSMSHKLNYYISFMESPEKILFEAYDENDNIISKRLLTK